MIRHLQAVKDRLHAIGGVDVYIDDATGATAPSYYIVSAPDWQTPDEQPVCGPGEVLDTDRLRVKAVAPTAEGVRVLLSLARRDLSPLMRWSALLVDGRSAQVKFERSEFVTRDITTTNTISTRAPAVGVDTYHMHSAPA